MKNILLCAGSEKNLEALSALIRSFIAAEITAVTSAAEARRLIAEFPETDLVIVNTPPSDEQGVEMTVQRSVRSSPLHHFLGLRIVLTYSARGIC